MDAKSLGSTICKLRRRMGYTQTELGEKLNVSGKTVSRWENGLGFPEVAMFPEIAKVFGVSVDYLMTSERNGITIAGNILTDVVKLVDCYPESGMLANIKDVSRAVGGCVPNTAIDLAKIDGNLPISVLGKIGDDEYGRYVMSQFNRYNIDCKGVSVSPDKPTSFSDVMSQPSGERTFFHARGANVDFSPADIDITSINSVILHIGYILLLDSFDKEDSEYGTVMARFLHDVQEVGIKTSIDVVSDSSADYKAKILPALKYCNYAILNEIESCMLSGLAPYGEGKVLNIDNIRKTMELMADYGVKDKIVVHCKDAGFSYDVHSKKFTVVPSVDVPRSEIKGSVGAGDAFCAGTLYALYHKYDDERMLEFAASTAACNLFSENSVDGMLPKEEVLKMIGKYGFVEIKK